MKENKFRAWDGEKMIPFTLGDIYGYEGEVCGVLLPDGTLLNSQSGYRRDDSGVNSSLTIMPYTGLKVKNGEVYGGDLVKCVRMADGNVFDAWTDTDGYNPNTKALIFEIKKDAQGIDWVWPSDIRQSPSYWEIIGNAHENGDLLK